MFIQSAARPAFFPFLKGRARQAVSSARTTHIIAGLKLLQSSLLVFPAGALWVNSFGIREHIELGGGAVFLYIFLGGGGGEGGIKHLPQM